MKRGHSTKKIGFGCSCFWTPIGPTGLRRSIVREFSSHTTSIAATTASNGTASSQAAPHRKNAAQRNRSDSPYQGRTAQKDNPTQLIIKQAVDFLIRQVEAGKSETLAAYLTAMARFHKYSFGNIVAIARQRAVT